MTKTFIIITFLSSFTVFGQTGNIVIKELDSIRHSSNFEVLNPQEQRSDSLSVTSLKKRIEKVKSSSTYRNSLSSSEQNDTILKMNEYAIMYKENRSRFKMKEYENNILKDSIDVDRKSKAICLFEDSTLSILTGFGIFGGIYFKVDIQGNIYNASVTFDEYKEKIFKKTLTDTNMVSTIEIPFGKEIFYLDHKPNMFNGEILNGSLIFETKSFYKSSEFDPYLSIKSYDPKKVNVIYYTGELQFTCKVLEQKNRIE